MDIEIKTQIFHRIKMGQELYYLRYSGRIEPYIRKVLVTNFPKANGIYGTVNLLELDSREKMSLMIDLNQIPIKGQTKDTILLSNCIVLATDKQSAKKCIKQKIVNYAFHSISQYLDVLNMNQLQKDALYIYHTVINRLKTL